MTQKLLLFDEKGIFIQIQIVLLKDCLMKVWHDSNLCPPVLCSLGKLNLILKKNLMHAEKLQSARSSEPASSHFFNRMKLPRQSTVPLGI